MSIRGAVTRWEAVGDAGKNAGWVYSRVRCDNYQTRDNLTIKYTQDGFVREVNRLDPDDPASHGHILAAVLEGARHRGFWLSARENGVGFEAAFRHVDEEYRGLGDTFIEAVVWAYVKLVEAKRETPKPASKS